jgi:signal-transduction protein with cAMP-binding, CBS, and nucleotidyltransferase domain
VVTDRDMVIRGIAKGVAPSRHAIAEIMTPNPEYCFEDESVDEATEKMAALRIRRIFVLDRDRTLVGVLSLGDVALDSEVEPREMADTLRNIFGTGTTGTAGVRNLPQIETARGTNSASSS